MRKRRGHRTIMTTLMCFSWCLSHLDISRWITNHLVGPDHTPTHHKTVGVLVITVSGILTSLGIAFAHSLMAEAVITTVGNSIHALGFIPFIRQLEGIEKTITTFNTK